MSPHAARISGGPGSHPLPARCRFGSISHNVFQRSEVRARLTQIMNLLLLAPWPTVRAATSERRSPQPRSTARIARSRRPLAVVASGVFNSVCACRTDSQLPKRTPLGCDPLNPRDPAGQFGR